MAENRRYYWLKLKEDFFTDKRIKRLRRISGGDTYTIIYLKLLLLSLKDSGKLYYDGVETDFIKELALTIDEKEDDVMVTVNYLIAQNLMEIIVENDEYFLTEIPSLIGSETASTRRSRKSREQKMLQCNTNATLGNLLQQNCNTEIEKEIDIELEKEGERKKKSLPPTLYGEYKNIRLTDEEYKKLKDKLQVHTDTMIEKLSRYLKSKGTDYKDHYVTILNWYEQDKEKLTQNNIQNRSSKTYSTNYEDSDSL
ncbi:TPA: phage replisome organizer N-terminal domain-containing protein [Streptococcus pneumoniae]|nr:putative phage-associated protein [Streptococcus pneumoniae]VIZ62892.1 putative phage-associated protein [Streptococcus pneumoniae]HES9513778.1 phage replisome organizer N-terminal domain-containing protein [Streptococcus pneumoniae]